MFATVLTRRLGVVLDDNLDLLVGFATLGEYRVADLRIVEGEGPAAAGAGPDAGDCRRPSRFAPRAGRRRRGGPATAAAGRPQLADG